MKQKEMSIKLTSYRFVIPCCNNNDQLKREVERRLRKDNDNSTYRRYRFTPQYPVEEDDCLHLQERRHRGECVRFFFVYIFLNTNCFGLVIHIPQEKCALESVDSKYLWEEAQIWVLPNIIVIMRFFGES
jgi:hypothetical protein